MPTFNVCVQIYTNEKKTQHLLKLQIFQIIYNYKLFDKASEKMRNICNFHKFCVYKVFR